MEIDEDTIDDAALALRQLTRHNGDPAWNGHDWDGLGRLHDHGMILDPVGKATSVVLTEEAPRRQAQRLCPERVRAAPRAWRNSSPCRPPCR